MSNSFIGLTMLVTLTSPPGAQVRGIVSGIEPGESLTLRNVTSLPYNKYVPEMTIKASEIAELVEAVSENAPPATRPPPPRATAVPHQAKTFEDPAILSVGKRPTPISRASIPTSWNGSAGVGAMAREDSARTTTGRDEMAMRDVTSPASLVEPMKKVVVDEEPLEEDEERHILDELTAERDASQQEAKADKPKRTRRRKGKKGGEDFIQDPAATPAKETTRSKGWRETPLLEPNPSFQPYDTINKKKGRRYGKMEENGWATEDATDVQDMGDFDFEGGLAKFDKQTIFSQLQAEDSVADEERLVSHNRLPKPKPGTAGGKNLHYTENVLEKPKSTNGTPKMKAEEWKSEADDSDIDQRTSPRGSGSGRQSRRAESKLATNRRPTDVRPVSRKGSANNPIPPARTLSIPNAPGKPAFFVVPADKRCEPISALQMLNLETIADNELGLSEDMMTENAGRGIAEVALSALNTSGRGLTTSTKATIPTVVAFAGNNKSGLRSIAAARHVRNHGLNVVVCVLGLEREGELLEGLRRQIKVFRGFGGKVLNKGELFEFTKRLDTPIDLIIDGLLGLTISFEELRLGDQATAYELISWANRNKASVLAIDVPTGIDPTTGKVSIIEGEQVYLYAKYVVAMGAPKKGLLEAMALGKGTINEDGVGKGKEWQLFVADIGLGAAVWKKAGTKVRRGIEFEGSWVLGMRFQGAAE